MFALGGPKYCDSQLIEFDLPDTDPNEVPYPNTHEAPDPNEVTDPDPLHEQIAVLSSYTYVQLPELHLYNFLGDSTFGN